MKKFMVTILGVTASFALTIVSARILFHFATNDAALRFAVRYVSSPLIAIAVGALVGLLIREKAQIIAALSLIPWTLWMVLTTNWSVATLPQIAVTIGSALVYMALGICAAALVGGRMSSSAPRQTAM
ncbi:MAG: hypothetical protein ACRD59_07875 [Candidatus Acidiferrales bacterium]